MVKHWLIGAGLGGLRMTGLHRLAAAWTRGAGAILTFHQVRTGQGAAFAPNAGLEITPAFLDALLGHVARRGYRVVPLDDVPALLAAGSEPFLALTFDDGTRDTLTDALPVLERHRAPFTVFATTGFLDRTARLWWVELELAIARLPAVQIEIGDSQRRLPTITQRDKRAAFATIWRELLRGDDQALLATVGRLAAEADLDPPLVVDQLCMNWEELARLARHPLASIGCHTLTHPRLARLPADALRAELQQSRARLEGELGRPIRTLCYPYGNRAAAGAREFGLAKALGFRCAVTTTPGLLVPGRMVDPMALPRISVNGLWQSLPALDVLLSGVAFPAWHRLEALLAA